MRFDVETFSNQLIAALKTNFTSQVASINTEKGDSLLVDLDAGAWFFESLDDKSHAFTNFVFIEIDNVTTQVRGSNLSKTYSFDIVFFLLNDQSGTVQSQTLRYWRAIEGASTAAWDTIGKGYDRATVQSLVPIDIKNVNTEAYYKLFGVSLTFTIP